MAIVCKRNCRVHVLAPEFVLPNAGLKHSPAGFLVLPPERRCEIVAVLARHLVANTGIHPLSREAKRLSRRKRLWRFRRNFYGRYAVPLRDNSRKRRNGSEKAQFDFHANILPNLGLLL